MRAIIHNYLNVGSLSQTAQDRTGELLYFQRLSVPPNRGHQQHYRLDYPLAQHRQLQGQNAISSNKMHINTLTPSLTTQEERRQEEQNQKGVDIAHRTTSTKYKRKEQDTSKKWQTHNIQPSNHPTQPYSVCISRQIAQS